MKLSKNDLTSARFNQLNLSEWRLWLFKYFPLSYCFIVIDNLLNEGMKTAYRYSLTMIKFFGRFQDQSSAKMTMKQVCIQVDRLISSKRLGSKAFKWTISGVTVQKLENRHSVLVRLKEDNS